MVKNLSVPDSDESEEIGNKPLFKPTMASSVVVDNSTTPPGGNQPNTYKPGAPREDTINGPVRKLHGATYMSHKQTQKRLNVQDSEIADLAKTIYAEELDLRRNIKVAQTMVNAATKGEIDEPSSQLAKALRLLARGNKTTRQAKEEARDIIMKKALENNDERM